MKPSTLGVIHQCAAGLFLAGDHVDHARGDARVVEALDQQGRAVGGVFRRLEHHRVPRQDGRRRRSAGEGDRKVEGRNHAPHAIGLEQAGVAMVLALGKLALDEALVLLHVIAVGADEIGRLLHIAQSLQAILAHFQAVHRGNVEEPLADERGHFAQQGNALLPGRGAPGREGGARRLDRPVDVAGCAVLEVAHDHAGVDGAVGGIGAAPRQPTGRRCTSGASCPGWRALRDGIFVVFVEQRVRAAQGGIGDFDVFAFGHGGIHCS